MARAGHSAAARLTPSASSAGGLGASRMTRPSSSRWSNTSGALSTHWPEEMHLSVSIVTFMGFLLSDLPWGQRRGRAPGDRQFVDAVDDRVVLERDLVQAGGQAQGGDALAESAVDDLQLHAGQVLA